MTIIELALSLLLQHREKNPRYIPGYRIRSADELQKFKNHKWYIKRDEGYITMPHWWGTHLLASDAAAFIETGLFVAIDRKR